MPQVNDPYETRRPIEYWTDMQEAALDDLGFTWRWCLIARLKGRIVEMEDEA